MGLLQKHRVNGRFWHHPAFEYVGKEIPLAEIVERAQHYRPLFGPDGGVTFGGGEPTLQANQLLLTIKALRQKGIHTAIETNAGTADFQKFVGLVDLLICDLKCISNDKHLHWMDADNQLVLQEQRESLEVEVLRQHHMGEPKYTALDIEYPMQNASLPERNEAQGFVDELVNCGFAASLGG
ncbi:MAG: radical SAM protein [Planctomycetota bacterium]|jgi:pyruvate-formate lyase-activating enzyme